MTEIEEKLSRKRCVAWMDRNKNKRRGEISLHLFG